MDKALSGEVPSELWPESGAMTGLNTKAGRSHGETAQLDTGGSSSPCLASATEAGTCGMLQGQRAAPETPRAGVARCVENVEDARETEPRHGV